MKSTILAVCLLLIASIAGATNVTQAVFSMTSSAATSTPNLRIVKMLTRQVQISQNQQPIQSIVWRAGAVTDYFLTKSQTVDLTDVLSIWVQVDQNTNVKVNSETAYMVLTSGTDGKVIVFK